MSIFDDTAGAVCVLCGHRGRGEAAPFFMTHGVAVWLCPSHRSPTFLRRRRGRVFTERLATIWHAAGVATARRLAALDAHRRRMRPQAQQRGRPGSYSWPKLRQEAEARFAAGEAPRAVIDDLRGRYRLAAARVPSVRTMHRWHAQARWLHPASERPARPGWLRRPYRSAWPDLPFHWIPDPFWPFSLWWIDDTTPKRAHWRRR